MTTLSPTPPSMTSVPGPPSRTSSPAPPSSVSLPAPPIRTSSPSPPSSVSRSAFAASAGGVDDVVAGQRVDRQAVAAGDRAGDVDARGEAEDLRGRAACRRPTTTSSPLVALTIDVVGRVVVAAERRASTRGEVGAGQVVDGERVGAAERASASIVSTSLRSMTMLAMSRVKRTRPPLAETSMRSLMFAAVEQHACRAPSWPSMMSLPSPGSHWNVSSPAPRKPTSLPCWPSTKSLPSPPRMMSTPLEPSRLSLPVPPSIVSLISAARLPVAEKRVVAAVGVEDEVLGRADVDRERRRVEAVEAHAGAVGRGRELLERRCRR